jgi:phage recombination protein Bet
MALTRSGAPAPTSSVSNAQALSNRSVQNANRAGSTAMQAASPSVPVEITAADGQHFTVSFGEVRSFICPQATDAECKIFLETCKQYHLNPFTKEAYLIHYDNKNADTASTIVLGKNCYLQMAERNPAYDGFEAGVVVLDTAVGELIHREGSLVFDGEELLGGWAKVYRKDRTRASYEEVKLSEYDTGKSLWNGKKATMIRKVALVHALREAFPSTFGALYDESEVRVDAESTAREVPPEELPVLDPYAGSHRHRKTAGTLIPAPDAPSAEENADDPFRGDDA